MSLILTPGNPEYEFIMAHMPPPPNWRSHEAHGEVGLIQDLETGMWRPANQTEFIEVMMEQGELYFSETEG
ncbi:hypothetical protein Lepto7376_3713 [[Leptolyngbya] sp. PCC 7376]|uniref:hypothetical protein n=1 Tax=[Leptolyngbya] sp. PCC 7376 TaxID=111781 RepID=UPI00029EFFF1|nr:hypothetical protein [[Leptolyngbya] sp. PCC 7376]AFY39889.1 hypothetical protein Lepto7376_3713 [[Leptolyngbya] sp. PCC 7376]